MNTSGRYIILVLGIILSLHLILSFSHDDYGRVTSLSNIASKLTGGNRPPGENPDKDIDEYYYLPSGSGNSSLLTDRRANATFVMLARNSDTDSAIRSIRDMEDRFNRKYRYPYVILNDEEWTDDFKRRLAVLTSAPMEFGQVSKEDWNQPDSIDEEKAKAGRDKMVEEGIIYGGSVSYRNMCRYNSGFFFKHELMTKYRWYWRIEPDVHFHCDLDYDPFLFMEDKKKVYGFTITMYEFQKTIPTLWKHTTDFIKANPQYVAKDNAMNFMSEDGGKTYNGCHFWSNFEIADMNFWRGEAYQAYFNYLEEQGGFYYERWGDAPVHSIAANLFASKDQIHFFDDVGYEHNPYIHCPRSEEVWKKQHCSCNRAKSFDYDGYSCLNKWDRLMSS